MILKTKNYKKFFCKSGKFIQSLYFAICRVSKSISLKVKRGIRRFLKHLFYLLDKFFPKSKNKLDNSEDDESRDDKTDDTVTVSTNGFTISSRCSTTGCSRYSNNDADSDFDYKLSKRLKKYSIDLSKPIEYNIYNCLCRFIDLNCVHPNTFLALFRQILKGQYSFHGKGVKYLKDLDICKTILDVVVAYYPELDACEIKIYIEHFVSLYFPYILSEEAKEMRYGGCDYYLQELRKIFHNIADIISGYYASKTALIT